MQWSQQGGAGGWEDGGRQS